MLHTRFLGIILMMLGGLRKKGKENDSIERKERNRLNFERNLPLSFILPSRHSCLTGEAR